MTVIALACSNILIFEFYGYNEYLPVTTTITERSFREDKNGGLVTKIIFCLKQILFYIV